MALYGGGRGLGSLSNFMMHDNLPHFTLLYRKTHTFCFRVCAVLCKVQKHISEQKP